MTKPVQGFMVAVDGTYTVLQLVLALGAAYKAGADRRLPVYTDCELLHHAGLTLDVEVRALPDDGLGPSMLVAEYCDETFDFNYSPLRKELAQHQELNPARKAKLGYKRRRAEESYG